MLQKSGTPPSLGAQEIWESIAPSGHTEMSAEANKRPVIFSAVSVYSWSLAFVGAWAGRPGKCKVTPMDTSFLPPPAGHSRGRRHCCPGEGCFLCWPTCFWGVEGLGIFPPFPKEDSEASRVTWVRS
uniref:Uncharacterized protein n=1 Tax=Mus musculus TaxID=10090 RepID=Q3TW44_MOUSE|nr:unnamed protein product [Mus musculus]